MEYLTQKAFNYHESWKALSSFSFRRAGLKALPTLAKPGKGKARMSSKAMSRSSSLLATRRVAVVLHVLQALTMDTGKWELITKGHTLVSFVVLPIGSVCIAEPVALAPFYVTIRGYNACPTC